jgi:hypothetical protein
MTRIALQHVLSQAYIAKVNSFAQRGAKLD